FHPIMALIAIQLVWITAVVFWIYWFIGKQREFRELAEKYRPELLGRGANWPVMVEGLVMLVLILIGVYVIFVYWNRQSNLYLQQRNIISQVTHELKSPLASIQLHLETIRLRKPSEERLDSFVGTMLSDTERLHYLINNLLMAARLEQRRKLSERRLTDLTLLVREHVERERATLPQGGSISFEALSSLKAMVDPEEMSMVVRNLFENAVLYSPQGLDISVRLVKTGPWLYLSVQDQGRGLEKKEQKKVFNRFYRVQPPGDNVRGTGLGLYIVESVIKGYGGTVGVTSDGPGKGCTFTVKLPAA
ncbi:MAG: HAMP domain-containing sensor histidine kinase, partial [Desulfuromonadaceae bacterium]|nr:HAMP domain-containing sensor histidine kinase [Desulfuromonadaceae bacterium]